jgi:hypothetical protein
MCVDAIGMSCVCVCVCVGSMRDSLLTFLYATLSAIDAILGEYRRCGVYCGRGFWRQPSKRANGDKSQELYICWCERQTIWVVARQLDVYSLDSANSKAYAKNVLAWGSDPGGFPGVGGLELYAPVGTRWRIPFASKKADDSVECWSGVAYWQWVVPWLNIAFICFGCSWCHWH